MSLKNVFSSPYAIIYAVLYRAAFILQKAPGFPKKVLDISFSACYTK